MILISGQLDSRLAYLEWLYLNRAGNQSCFITKVTKLLILGLIIIGVGATKRHSYIRKNPESVTYIRLAKTKANLIMSDVR